MLRQLHAGIKWTYQTVLHNARDCHRTTRLPRYPGSATSWQDHAFPGTTAFVVELPKTLSHRSAERYADAALTLIGS